MTPFRMEDEVYSLECWGFKGRVKASGIVLKREIKFCDYKLFRMLLH